MIAKGRRRPSARTRIAPRHQVLFFQQMEMLLSSGVLIVDALGSLKARFPDERTRRLLREVHAEVTESRSGLSGALARFSRSFPPGTIAVIEAGEEGGSSLLARRFSDLAERIGYEETHRRQIRQACTYPAFVIGLAGGLYWLLLSIVFPRLTELLASLGGQLPPLTRAVIGAARSLRQGLPAAVIFSGVGVGLVAALRRHPVAGVRIDRCLLHIPVVGSIYRDASVALICKIYRSLYLANQPAPANLDLCTRLVGNRALQAGLTMARQLITDQGARLSDAFSATGIFPPLACLAIETGEKSGQIAAALERVSIHFQAQAQRRTEAAITVINPLLVLAVVGGAGVILISFFQATYQIAYAVH
jgi:type II secretory pathway component PulF